MESLVLTLLGGQLGFSARRQQALGRALGFAPPLDYDEGSSGAARGAPRGRGARRHDCRDAGTRRRRHDAPPPRGAPKDVPPGRDGRARARTPACGDARARAKPQRPWPRRPGPFPGASGRPDGSFAPRRASGAPRATHWRLREGRRDASDAYVYAQAHRPRVPRSEAARSEAPRSEA